MKITLINVQICEANNLVPPFGILAVGSYLAQNGFTVQLIDEDIFFTDFSSKVIEFKPDLVGISFLTPAYTRAKKIVQLLKPLLPESKFCAGGFHPSIMPEQVLLNMPVDFCVIGEGEQTMLEACRALESSRGLESVDGLCLFDNNGSTFRTEQRHLIENLDELPFPHTGLLDFEHYLRPPGLFRGVAMERITTICTSRGCPFHCTYCGGRKLFSGRVRLRSPESIRQELERLVTVHDIRGIWIIDECFTIDLERARRIASLIAEFGLAWGMQTRVDLLDEASVRHFKNCGCIEINFGVESGSAEILAKLRKETTLHEAREAFRWCREAGVRTTANYMLGSPGETEAQMMETFAFAKELNASYTVFHITTPLPGTELYRDAINSGIMQPPKEFDESWVHRGSRGPLASTTVPPEQIMRLRAQFQNHFFLRNYATATNMKYGIKCLVQLVSSPRIFVRSLKSYLLHGRLDSFIETMVALINKTNKPGGT